MSKEGNEWREGWPMVLSAALAMGLTSIPFFSMGVFMQPLTHAFGWSRTDLTAAALMLATITSLGSPLVGAAADRWGARPLALVGCALACAAFGSLGLLQNSLWEYRGIWCMIALGLALAGPFTWSMGLAGRFDRHRGAALALALNGINILGAVTPWLADRLIAHFGWRSAYFLLGGGLFVVCFPLAFAVFFDQRSLARRTATGSFSDRTNAAPALGSQVGLAFADALRTRQFWLIGLALTVTGGGVVGLIVHLVPLLTDQGMSLSSAAKIASAISIAAICSGGASGFLLDRVFAPYLAVVIFLIPSAACLLLLNHPDNVASALLAAAIVGIASGAEVNLVSYLSARYFGFRSYGLIYGLLFGLFGIAQGATAFILGVAHDHFGSYRQGFTALCFGFAASAVSVLFLGKYPDFGKTTPRGNPVAAAG